MSKWCNHSQNFFYAIGAYNVHAIHTSDTYGCKHTHAYATLIDIYTHKNRGCVSNTLRQRQHGNHFLDDILKCFWTKMLEFGWLFFRWMGTRWLTMASGSWTGRGLAGSWIRQIGLDNTTWLYARLHDEDIMVRSLLAGFRVAAFDWLFRLWLLTQVKLESRIGQESRASIKELAIPVILSQYSACMLDTSASNLFALSVIWLPCP